MLQATPFETRQPNSEYTGSNVMAVQELSLNKISLARNSRMSISDGDLSELMASIKSVGLLQPIGVVRKGDGYQVCYGNRRFLAVSKLGVKKIPVIVHAAGDAFESDLKNLTENLQRRNISLAEAGRYIEILNKEGLNYKEIAARLGFPIGYITNCQKAYTHVPKEYRNDLEIKSSNRKPSPGKIPMKTAQAILSATTSFNLSGDQKRDLFKAAKSDTRFSAENVNKYASAMKSGKSDPIGTTKPLRQVVMKFIMTEDEYNRIKAEYVVDGPFNSITGVFEAILTGKKNIKINLKGG